MTRLTVVAGTLLLVAASLHATIFGTVRGLIHDPQHRPVSGAQVTLRSAAADFSKSVISDDAGEFQFQSLPLGDYYVTVTVPGFALQQQKLALTSGGDARLHFSLILNKTKEVVEVQDTYSPINPESSTSQNVVSRREIAETPGGDRSNSLSVITNYTPGSYMIHDQLHIRGGHQVSWLLDGVPVPNTNIASNVGPQFDPKDIDYLEVQRGGYNAEYGDRTYGVFNVVTRSGFERNRQAELVASYGSFHATDNQISFGDHRERFAYYGSLSGYRTDLGLETPTPQIIHDQAAGISGFASLIFNKTPNDQLRLVTSVRGDHFQVPNTPEQQVAGIRDVDNERDAFVNFSWLHTIGTGTVLTLSPFYHFNRAHYIGGPNDAPVIPEDERGSNYVGGVASLGVNRGRHNLRTGLQVFGQRDNQFFGLGVPGNPKALTQRQNLWGNTEAIFLEDQFKDTRWLTLNAGVRLTHFNGGLSENAADPRIGAALRIPRLGWVARAFWGRYYQAPPLLTVNGPVIENAVQQGFGFLPLRGERDEQREFGLAIPIAGWTIDIAQFRTAARNFFDHDALGNSNIFFPVTIERARIRGWEGTIASPIVAGRAQFHLAYSHQYVEARGGVSGGLTDFEPPSTNGFYYLDHDQRNTLASGVNFTFPWKIWSAFNLSYGSGYLDEDGPAHLPAHRTYDVSFGKSFGENWSLRLTGLNLANHHYLLDNSNTFGGTHFANPREIAVQVRYRFRY